jgi:hypothetical protein
MYFEGDHIVFNENLGKHVMQITGLCLVINGVKPQELVLNLTDTSVLISTILHTKIKRAKTYLLNLWIT